MDGGERNPSLPCGPGGRPERKSLQISTTETALGLGWPKGLATLGRRNLTGSNSGRCHRAIKWPNRSRLNGRVLAALIVPNEQAGDRRHCLAVWSGHGAWAEAGLREAPCRSGSSSARDGEPVPERCATATSQTVCRRSSSSQRGSLSRLPARKMGSPRSNDAVQAPMSRLSRIAVPAATANVTTSRTRVLACRFG